VVRIFEDDDIIHVEGKIDPLADIEVINLELILADLSTVSKRLQNLGKEIKAGKKDAVIESKILERVKNALESGKLASTVSADEFEAPFLRQIHLLTSKPFMYVLNKKSGGKNLDEPRRDLGQDQGETLDERWTKLLGFLKTSGAKWVIVDAGIEQELKDLEDKDKAELREGLGGNDDGINNLIKAGYELLSLMTYFTTGEDETRAWTIHTGWTAPMAGTAIHGDFKDKFIKAEVINWQDLLDAGSYAAARLHGLVRTEGKEYVVKDGDVIEFKI